MGKINKVTKVTTRKYNYRTMVERADPKRRTDPEPGYVFGNGRKFATKKDPYK